MIRHTSNDRIVAMIEVLSRGNKSNRHSIRAFLDKAVAALMAEFIFCLWMSTLQALVIPMASTEPS